MTFREISLVSVGFKQTQSAFGPESISQVFFAAVIKPHSTDRGAHLLTYSEYKIKDSSSCTCLGGQSLEEEEALTQEDKKIAQLITSMVLLGLVSCVLWILFLVGVPAVM